METVASAHITRKQILPTPLPEDKSFLYCVHWRIRDMLHRCPHLLLDSITSLFRHSGLKFPSLTWNVRVFIFASKLYLCRQTTLTASAAVTAHSELVRIITLPLKWNIFTWKKKQEQTNKKISGLNYLKGGYRKEPLLLWSTQQHDERQWTFVATWENSE